MILIILLNAILIGIQTVGENEVVNSVQRFILIVFVIEILVRWIGKESTKEYFSNGWNWFDIIIVSISFIPETLFADATAISAFRVLRVFRVLRIFKAFPELQLMVRVLLKSFKSVVYAGLLLVIFMYIYSIIGVMIFKGNTTVVTAHTDFIDPFDSIDEAFFSLFRVSTGEDWTDLRYDLMSKTSKVSPIVIDIYYISWYILSAFLLLNIVFGSIINNYEVIYNEHNKIADDDDDKQVIEKISSLETQIENLRLLIEANHRKDNKK